MKVEISSATPKLCSKPLISRYPNHLLSSPSPAEHRLMALNQHIKNKTKLVPTKC